MRRVLCLFALILMVASCDDSGGSTATDTTQPTTDAVSDLAISAEVASAPDLGGEIAGPVEEVTPDLAAQGPQPPAPPIYAGTCPNIVAGTNTILAETRARSFEVFLPPHPTDNGTGLVYVWHGNGDSAKSLAGYFLAQEAANEYNAIVVAPSNCCNDSYNDCCDFSMTWNMGSFSKTEADLSVFDGILACVDEQFNIDNRRVYTTGFSAGSLWSSYLVVNRGQYLAAATIFSGGTGLVVEYKTPGSSLPVLLAWGGTADVYMGVVDFQEMSLAFSENLRADGHFVAECDHGLGHTIPFGGPSWGNRWLFAHEWGDEGSPFAEGLTEDFPEYCSLPE
jgi:predicted esterase